MKGVRKAARRMGRRGSADPLSAAMGVLGKSGIDLNQMLKALGSAGSAGSVGSADGGQGGGSAPDLSAMMGALMQAQMQAGKPSTGRR